MQHQLDHVVLRAGTLYILSGLPGSGKTSLRELALGLPRGAWVSSDALREQILGYKEDLDSKGSPRVVRYESANASVFAMMRMIVKERLSEGLLTIIDATNPTDADRADWVDLAASLGAPAEVLILGTPLEECLQNNQLRNCVVPEHAIRAMHTPPATVAVPPKNGKAPAITPPQGFMMTSRFPHQVITNNTTLRARPHELTHARYDVIGDVHGLLDDLLALLSQAGWHYENGHLSHPEGRKLLFLGDLVDRGPDSIGVLKLIRQAVLDGVAEAVKGNHDKKLVQFFDLATAGEIETWSSKSNAETGVHLLKMSRNEASALVEFIRKLPSHYVLADEELAFVHGDIHTFDPLNSLAGSMIYGDSARGRAVDSDAMYEERYRAGFNKYIMFRGHIPQTSPQQHVFSLERQPFQNGELVLMRLDKFLEGRRRLMTNQQSFMHSLITHKCDYDFDEVSKKWDVLRGMEKLVQEKLATGQHDESKLLRAFKYSKQVFWEGSWDKSPWLMKARGMVLDIAGNIVSHPFDKCFNYRENGVGLDIGDDVKVIEVDKLNGFLGIISAHPFKPGELLMHTQGGFGGDFVQYIRDYAYEGKTRGALARFLANNDVTMMFEVLHPSDPHIIEYRPEDMGLHLIGIRGKQLADLPWTEEELDEAAKQMGLRRPAWRRTTFGEVKRKMRDCTGEGCMVRTDDDKQVTLLKFKTPYYLTTKFLGRMSKSKVAHMFGNSANFKRTVDEEFYPIVDELVATVDKDSFMAMPDTERIPLVRQLINKLQ